MHKYFKIGIDSRLGLGEFYEFLIKIIYSSILKEGDFTIDGGANIGRHTIPMAQIVGEKGLVLAFEPLSQCAEVLRSKCISQKLTNIVIIQKALGSTIGQTEFTYVLRNTGLSGIKQRQDISTNEVRKITVPLTTLDYEIKNFNKKVRFIKLDLEGGEFHALCGAQEILTYHAPFIVFENGREYSAELYGYDRNSFFNLFQKCGYKVFDVTGDIFSIDKWDLVEMPWYYIAVKRYEDIYFVEYNLPQLVEALYELINRILSV